MFETQIKQALKNAGLDEGLYSKITVKAESEIADAVKKLQREIDDDEILKALEAAGLKDKYEKLRQSQIDQRVNQALKTREEKERKEREAKEAEDARIKKEAEEAERNKANLEGKSDTEKMLIELQGTVKALTEKFDNSQKVITQFQREKSITSALKTAGLPEKLAKYVTGDDEDAIKASIESIKSDLTELKQAENDALLAGGRPPAGGEASAATEAAIIDYAKTRNPGAVGSTGGGLASAQIAKSKKE